jgi:hypothetical protein
MPGKIDPKELSVNQDEMDLVYKYYWGIPTIQMCRNMIRQHLFSNGIEFKSKSGSNANNFSQHIMEDFWLPFCEDALDQALTYGFVVWRTRRIGDTIVPIVCLKDTYRLTVKEVDGVLEYKIYDKGEKNNEILKGAYVYDEFGYRPLIDGGLMSMLHTLIPDIQYYFTMLNCQVSLEKKRVKPPILTQLNNTRGLGNGTGENEGIDYDFYADADIAEAEDEAKYKRNKNAVDALKNQQKLYDDFFEPGQDYEVSAPSILDQMVPIPSGQTIATYAPQQGRNDVPIILKGLQDTICGVLGVPKSMIMSDTPHKSDAVGTHQMFQTTIVWWKRQISEMCQMIYNIINAKELTNQVGDKLNARKNKPDTKDIYLMTKNMSSRITFPTTPFTTNEELFQLYTQGVIDWKTYCTYIARNTSIPMDTIPDEPLKDNEKKELMGIAKDPPPNQGLPGDPKAPGGSVKPGEETASPTEKKEKEHKAKEKKAEEGAAGKTNVKTDDKKDTDKKDAVNKAVGSKPADAKAKDSKADSAKPKQPETSQKQAPAKKKEGDGKPVAKKGGDDNKKPPPKKGGDDKDKKDSGDKGDKGDKKKKPDDDKKKPGDKKDDKSGKSDKSKGSDGDKGDKKFDKSGTDKKKSDDKKKPGDKKDDDKDDKKDDDKDDKKKPGDKKDDDKDDKKRKSETKADESEEDKKKKKKKDNKKK